MTKHKKKEKECENIKQCEGRIVNRQRERVGDRQRDSMHIYVWESIKSSRRVCKYKSSQG